MNIHCENAGLWSKHTGLKIINRGTGSWGYMVQECRRGDEDITAVTIDELVARYDFSSIDILKLDVEGSEYELMSQNNSLWLSMTRLMIIETHERV